VNGNNVSGIVHVTFRSYFSQDIDVPLAGSLTSAIDLNLSMPNGQTALFTLMHLGGHPRVYRRQLQCYCRLMLAASRGSATGSILDVTGDWGASLVPCSFSPLSIVSQITDPWTGQQADSGQQQHVKRRATGLTGDFPFWGSHSRLPGNVYLESGYLLAEWHGLDEPLRNTSSRENCCLPYE
jgi:hypothetical protein